MGRLVPGESVMRDRLIGLVLRVYPAPVRERYGAEVTEMLRGSTRPTRDLLDVLRSALADRLVAIRWGRTALLLLTPAIFTVAWSASTLTAMWIAWLVDPDAGYDTVRIAGAAGLLPVLAVVAWAARSKHSGRPAHSGRSAHPGPPAAPLLPVVFGAGLVGWAFVPIAWEALGENRPAALASISTWVLVMVLGRSRPVVALAALVLACVVQVLVAPPYGLDTASWNALLWYPSVISGTDGLLLPGVADGLSEPLKALPVVLTICTVHVLNSRKTGKPVDYELRLSRR